MGLPIAFNLKESNMICERITNFFTHIVPNSINENKLKFTEFFKF